MRSLCRGSCFTDPQPHIPPALRAPCHNSPSAGRHDQFAGLRSAIRMQLVYPLSIVLCRSPNLTALWAGSPSGAHLVTVYPLSETLSYCGVELCPSHGIDLPVLGTRYYFLELVQSSNHGQLHATSTSVVVITVYISCVCIKERLYSRCQKLNLASSICSSMHTYVWYLSGEPYCAVNHNVMLK